MDSYKYGRSTVPLNHEPYDRILSEHLVGVNKGKMAVVTGAARGIGRAISVALAQSGASLALLDILEGPLAETMSLCEAYTKTTTHICDLTDPSQLSSVFRDIGKEHGPVDILVNNAGVSGGKWQREESFSEFWRGMEINFRAPLMCAFEVLPSMRQRRQGCIINIASRAALVDVPTGMSYCASKTALVRAFSTLQEELEAEGLGESICTYCLHPGAVWTSMPQGAGESMPENIRELFVDVPELCANTCAYMASGKAKAIRGRYFDCRQDIDRVCSFGRQKLQEDGLYSLEVKFIPGYANEP